MFVVIDDFPIKHRWLPQLSEASPFLGFPSLPSWRLGLDCTPNRTVLLDLLVYHDWKKGLKFVGDMYFSIKMCFYTTELLHRFLDFAVGCCLSRRCHDRSPQPGISIMLAPGGPETDSRTHVQRDYSVMVSIKSGSSPILVYGHMANMCI